MSTPEFHSRSERRAEQRATTFAERRAQRRQFNGGRLEGHTLRVRQALFAAIAVVVAVAAVSIVVTRLTGPAATDVAAIQVRASMGGFDPNTLTVKAGQPFKIELASMDSSMHSDGGGWHQFAIDELGISWKVGPESSTVFDSTAPATPGTYAFYCDICCGGKENPSMRGTLTVEA